MRRHSFMSWTRSIGSSAGAEPDRRRVTGQDGAGNGEELKLFSSDCMPSRSRDDPGGSSNRERNWDHRLIGLLHLDRRRRQRQMWTYPRDATACVLHASDPQVRAVEQHVPN